MSLPSQILFGVGNVKGMVYDFAAAGDILPLHDHPEGEGAHITIVARGSCKIVCQGREDAVHLLGAVVDPDYPHAIEALEANTRIVNIVK